MDKVHDSLVPDPVVQQELNITAMTLWRWTNDPDLGFAPKIQIRGRNYRSRNALEQWKRRMVAQGAARRRA